MNTSRIRILNEQTINKIAAGEVVENPASVVKELVENSLDAGASSICVEIQEGGRQLIRVSDDGCGMSQDDALLCLERHATSKILDVEDIEALTTMGFRGEAIPSIAAISKLTLLTAPRRENGSETGTFIRMEGGRILSCSAAPRHSGTTVEVKSLFFNVPVRRKFQRSPSFDAQEILKMLGLLALANPTIQFELISDQKSVLKTPLHHVPHTFQDTLAARMEVILGSDFAPSLLHAMEFNNETYQLMGFIGSPHCHRPNRTGQHLFINQRCVHSPMIAAAIREGYHTMLPTHRYPLFVLHLNMPGTLLDINVHPQKKEVRLRQEELLKATLMQAVQTSLSGRTKEKEPFFPTEKSPPPPFWATKGTFFSSPPTSQVAEEKWEYQSNPLPKVDQPLLFENQVSNILATLTGYTIIDSSQLDERLFVNCQTKKRGGLALMDQRAAYRRIHYEQLLNKISAKESQTLLFPVTLQVTPSEAQMLKEYLPTFNQMGFGLREFGENTLLIDTLPLFLKQEQLPNFIALLTQDLIEMQSSRRLQMEQEKQVALSICQASLPTLKCLTIQEAGGLLKQLLACEIPSQCPLGKPTCLYFEPEEIAKWFKK